MPRRRIGWVLAATAIIGASAAAPAYSQSLGSLTGRVFEDLNGNGLYNAGEPCVNSRVSLRPAAGGSARTYDVYCGESSSYFFSGLALGLYVLSVVQTTPPDYELPSVQVLVNGNGQRDLPLRRRATQRVCGRMRRAR